MTIWHCVIIVYASTPVGAWERRMQHEFCKCRKDMEGGRFWPHSENKHGMLCLKRYHNFFSASSILLEQPVQITVKIDIVSEKTKAFCFTHLSLTSDHTTWIWVSWAKFRNFDFTLRLIPSNWPMFSKWSGKICFFQCFSKGLNWNQAKKVTLIHFWHLKWMTMDKTALTNQMGALIGG